MKFELSLALIALLAVANVHSLPKVDNLDMDELMNELEEKKNSITKEDIDSMKSELGEYLSIFVDSDSSSSSSSEEGPVGEIGSEFDLKQFMRMLKQDATAAYQRKCKKLTGDADGYEKAMAAKKEVGECMGEWFESEGFEAMVDEAEKTKDVKPMLKKFCAKRSGLYACVKDKKSATTACMYPSEVEHVEKMHRIMANLVDMVCAYEKDDFAVLNEMDKVEKCMGSNQEKLMTCANKAVYSVAKRITEKFIENEHFKFEMEPEDCKEFDASKSCFVSSVEGCDHPFMKDTFSSVFQIFRNETECAK